MNKNIQFILTAFIIILIQVIFLNKVFCEEDNFYKDSINIERFGDFQKTIPILNENSTIFDYMSYAAISSPELKAAFAIWQSSLKNVTAAKVLPDPKFTYAYFIKEVETRVGPQRQKFGISQTFPWIGKLSLKGEKALLEAAALEEKFNAEKLDIFYNIQDIYYEYYYIRHSIDVTKESVDLVSFLEGIARSNFRLGKSGHADIIRAQIELEKLNDQLRSLKDLQIPIKAKFNAILNRPFDAVISWPEKIYEKEISVLDHELIEILKKENPEIRALDYKISALKKGIYLSKKDFYPDITIGLEYIDTDDSSMPDTKDSGKDPLIAMVSLNLPIWFHKNIAVKKEANINYSAVIKQKKALENKLIANLKTSIYYLRDANRKITLYRDSLIPKAEQCFRITRDAFSTGTSDFLDLIDAQRTLLEFQLSYERSKVNYAIRIAEINKLVGGNIE